MEDLTDRPNSSFNPVPEAKDPNTYDRRSIQDIIGKTHRADFFEAGNSGDDSRVKLKKSVFSPVALPKNQETKEVKEYLEALRDNRPTNYNAYMQMLHSVLCISISPSYLQDMLEFRNECIAAFIALGINNDVSKFLRSELEGFTDSLRHFYWNLSSIQAVAWLRSRGQSRKRQLIDEGYPFTYSKVKAEQVVRLMLELNDSKDHVRDILLGTANDFSVKFGMFWEAILLYEQLLKFNVSKLESGLTWQEIGVCYRELKQYPQMVQSLKQALAHFKDARDLYYTCVCMKNLGEAEWMAGDKAAALSSYRDAELNAEKLTMWERMAIIFNLAISSLRTGDKENELRYLKTWLKLNAGYSVEAEPDLDDSTKEDRKEREMQTASYVNLRIDEIIKGF